MTYDDLIERLRHSGKGQDDYHIKYPERAFEHLNNSGLVYEAANAIRDLQAQNVRLREQMEKLCRAAIPMFTDEDGLVHFDTHPKAIDLWSEVADARIVMKDTP